MSNNTAGVCKNDHCVRVNSRLDLAPFKTYSDLCDISLLGKLECRSTDGLHSIVVDIIPILNAKSAAEAQV